MDMSDNEETCSPELMPEPVFETKSEESLRRYLPTANG
jgi:hypothetical protein